MVLTVDDLVMHYGRSQILNGVDLGVEAGELVCVVGRNGVGKTTLLKGILNLVTPTSGRVAINGQDVTGWPSYEISRLGVGYVPQSRDVFPDMTVEENLQIPLIAAGRDRDLEHVYEQFPILAERRDQRAATMSGGQQQMLAIGRGMAARPELLLMDEPSEGIQPSIVADIRDKLNQLKGETSILMVEQNVPLTRATADRCYVMQRGAVVADGRPESMALEDLIAA